MRRFRTVIVFVAAALGGITPALAASLSGTADPGLGSVQWSSAIQRTYVRYDVTIQNTGQPDISGWKFRARTSVAGGTSSPTATFNKDFSDPACNLLNPLVPTEIICDFSTGTLPGQTGTKSFSVVFNAPSSGDGIDFSWRAFWDESGSGGNDGFVASTRTGLYGPNPDKVSSVVPAGAGALTFFTGGGIATPVDPWVTIVKVPDTLQGTTATVEEAVLSSTCAGNLIDCRTSTLTIPVGTFGNPGHRPLVDPATGNSPFLQITLLRDASTISRGASIDSAIVYYRHDLRDTDPFPLPKDIVPRCDSTTFTPLPRANHVCEDLTQRFAYPKKNTPKTPVNAGFESDWRFVLYAVDNGRMAN